MKQVQMKRRFGSFRNRPCDRCDGSVVQGTDAPLREIALDSSGALNGLILIR